MAKKYLKFIWQEHRSYYLLFISLITNLTLIALLTINSGTSADSAELVKTYAESNQALQLQLQNQNQLIHEQNVVLSEAMKQVDAAKLALADAAVRLKAQQTALVDYKTAADSCSNPVAEPSLEETQLAMNQNYEERLYEMVFNSPYP